MDETKKLLVFHLDDWRCALQISVVQRVIPRVEITPLPKAPEIVLGLIVLQGAIVPVVDMRRRFRLPEREAELNDRLIVAKTTQQTLAFPVDKVQGIQQYPLEDILNPTQIVPGMEFVEGVIKTQEGILFIHDLDRFLSWEEEASLNYSLQLQESDKE